MQPATAIWWQRMLVGTLILVATGTGTPWQSGNENGQGQSTITNEHKVQMVTDENQTQLSFPDTCANQPLIMKTRNRCQSKDGLLRLVSEVNSLLSLGNLDNVTLQDNADGSANEGNMSNPKGDSNKPNCSFAKATCLERFQKNITTDRNISTIFKKKLYQLCRCDADCSHYGDCCMDQAHRGAGARYSCVSLDIGPRTGVLMVSRCLPKYEVTRFDSYCTLKVDMDQYSYLLDFPVTSEATNESYANYYCARCNDDYSQLVERTMMLNCTTRPSVNMAQFMASASYLPGLRQWHSKRRLSTGHIKKITCIMQVVEFKDVEIYSKRYNSRLCAYPTSLCPEKSKGSPRCMEQILHCDPTWPDNDDVYKCNSYSLMMEHNNTIYKNPHCARCNYINISDPELKCFSPTSSQRGFRSFKLPQAFSTVLDFSTKVCSKDQLYDPLNNQCYYMQCISNDGKVSTDCKVNNCLKKILNVDEYYFGGNGSIIDNVTGTVYQQGDYELNNSKALICDEKLIYLSSITSPQKIVTFVVLLLSLICLFAHITIYILLPKLRNLPGRNLFSLSCSLFTAHLLFLVGAQVADNIGMCMVVGLSLHYFWLASFCWMNVMSLDVYITFRGHVHRRPGSGGKTYLKYSVYAWGVPLIIIMSALITQFTEIMPSFKPQYAGKICWINNRDALILFFIFPIGVIVLENVALFIGTSYGIYQQIKMAKFAMKRSQSVKPDSQLKKMHKNKESSSSSSKCHQGKPEQQECIRLLLYIKLGVIQGLTWTTGFLAAFTGFPVCWYIFTILNGLQGTFIFLSFDLKRKVWESLKEQLSSRLPRRMSSKDTRTTTLSSIANARKHSNKSQRSLGSVRIDVHSPPNNGFISSLRHDKPPCAASSKVLVNKLGRRTDRTPVFKTCEYASSKILNEDPPQTRMLNTSFNRNSLHDYLPNSVTLYKLDDSLAKITDKSFLKSFEIEKIVNILEHIKNAEQFNKQDTPQKSSRLGDASVPGKLGVGLANKTAHITRSQSLTCHHSDLYNFQTPFADKTRLSARTSNSVDDIHSAVEMDHPHPSAQLSHLYTQDQLVHILSSRLMTILQGPDSSTSCDFPALSSDDRPRETKENRRL